MTLKLVFLGVLVSVVGCGSSDSGSGGSCTVDDSKDPVFTAVTKAAGSDAACPTLTPADLNGGGDSGASSSCAYVTNKSACTLDLDCTDGTATSKGHFALSGSTFSGNITVTIGSVTCTYTTSGTD